MAATLLRPPHHFFFFFFFILTLFLTLSVSLSTSDDDELQILLNLKSSLAASTQVFDTWTNDNSPCNFSGIVCGADGMVTEINLPQRGLSSTAGSTLLAFDSICSLQNLKKLSFESNSLSGEIFTTRPSTSSHDPLSKCNKLQHLDLSMNSFTGQLPPDLSSLTQLKFLNLNGSGFSGPFPWKSLENLTSLQFLSLGDNPFEPTPFPLQLLNLDKLYWLYLSNCSLHGRVPEGISNLTLLENLELSDNALFGEIPKGITNLQKLWQLELYNNDLGGKLPDGFGNLTALINFDASNNSLQGDLSELKTLTRLQSLQLFENGFSGDIPEEFGSFKFLTEFSLYTNKLTGSLPWSIGSWSDFEFIDVSDNSLSGLIPPDMCKKGQMTKLLILQNNFTGEIPATYADCASLIRFRVNDNSLSGTVPDGIWSLPNMTIIDLSSNKFQGSVGQSIGNAKSLAQLFLANNQFSGELPANISDAVSLVAVDLRSNRFSGKIPAKIGQLTNLDSLHLENNLFSGPIPRSIGSCRSISEVNLAGNSLSGEIPGGIGTLPNLNYLNLSSNNLSGEIPSSLSSLTLTLLDLTNNRLFGPIPESLLVPPFTGSFTGNPDLCSNKNRKYPPCSSVSRRHNDIRKVVGLFIAGVTILAVSITCYVRYNTQQSNRKIDQEQDHPIKRHGSWDMRQFHLLSFTEDEVVNAVRTENLIGKGGSGNVYKVVLANGKKLAVKHIWRSDGVTGESFRSSSSSGSGSNRAILGQRRSSLRSSEFEAEVAALSCVRHVNVVKLYCSIRGESSDLLVYEYMSNGSLWDRLHNTCRKMEMEWWLRFEIAVGSARGLDYLHHGCERPVIHRDVKSSNILLDDEMRPRIADFGLAKILKAQGANDATTTTYIFAGTHGYMAPECGYTNKVNEKCDVYSFGVVLMELVTGRKPVEAEFGESKDIVQWVFYEMMTKRNNGESLVDPTISEALRGNAARVLGIALRCTTRVPGLRPSMRAVVQMLEEAGPR